MKRKRGPAPRGNKRKHKRELEEKRQRSDSEVDDAIDEDEESFHGFSSGDEDEPDSPTLEDEDKAATAGSSDKHTAKKAKKSAPSKEELVDLLLRSSPFQSNLFKLQTEELLAEVRVKYDKMTKLETALHRLKEVIMAIPTSKEQLVEYFIIGLTFSCTNLKWK
jgi:U3 small nucleolar RNA-associated protein 22